MAPVPNKQNGAKRGDEFFFYRAEDFASPVWDLCDNILDVEWSESKNKLESKRRGKKRIQYRAGMEDLECKVTMQVFDGDADRAAFDDSYENENIMVVGEFDDLVTQPGAEGFKDQLVVVERSKPRKHGEIVIQEYTLVPADVPIGEEPEDITIV